MSIAYIDRVWRHSLSRGGERLVLLAIADCANDEGLAWPSLETIARKAAIHRTTVLRLERALEKRGELVVERSRGRVANRYRLVLQPSHDALPLGTDQQSQSATVEPSQSATVANRNGSNSSSQQSHSAHPTVAHSATGSVREPSGTVTNSRRGWRTVPEAERLTDQRRGIAAKAGLPLPLVEPEWLAFMAYEFGKAHVSVDRTWTTWCYEAVRRLPRRKAVNETPGADRSRPQTGRAPLRGYQPLG